MFPGIKLESKTNSTELVKVVGKINDQNKYIIALDCSFDNDNAIRETKQLRDVIKEKGNILTIKLISFEYILLEFQKLFEWIFVENDELRNKRSKLINIRLKLLQAIGKKEPYQQIRELKEWVSNIEIYNIEQITAKLLFEITRNTRFEINKSNLGQCWKVDCCSFEGRQENDICGLDNLNFTLQEKMKEVYLFSSLKQEFVNIGMDVTM